MIDGQEFILNDEQRTARKKVKDYLNRYSLEKYEKSGLEIAAIYCAMTTGYEITGNTRRPTFKDSEHVLLEVKKNLAAWEAMSLMTKYYAKNNLALTNEMTEFITRSLDGELKKPKQSTNKWKNINRDLYLSMAVYMLNEKKVAINEATEIVAELAKQCGIGVGAETVRKAWGAYKEHVRNTVAGGTWYFIEARAFPLKK